MLSQWTLTQSVITSSRGHSAPSMVIRITDYSHNITVTMPTQLGPRQLDLNLDLNM